MNKVVLLILTGAVALLTEGCSFFSDFADSRKKLNDEAAKPNSVKIDTSANQTQKLETEGEEFADLENDSIPVQPIAGLIPATNPESRVRSSVRGRQDPFSTVTLTPRIEIEAKKEVAKTSDENNRNFNRFNNQDNQPKLNNNNLQAQAQRVKSPAQGNNRSIAAKEAFIPTLAQQVVISGLYEAGGRTRLIIQAPEENTSRYVEVGQYLSNGKVLVKSIDRNHLPTPRVILEQSGVEVSKDIGEVSEDFEDKLSTLPGQASNEAVNNLSSG